MISLNKSNPSQTLNLLFYLFNLFLFDSKLPTIKVVARNLESLGLSGYFKYIEDTETKDRVPDLIAIDPKCLDPARTLLHEMCHAYHRIVLDIRDPRNHPPSFVRLLRSKYKKMGFEVDPLDISPGYEEL